MGRLVYEDVELPLDDRTLAHVQVVVLSRLRRGESFPFSWKHADGEPGRTTVWIHPAAKLAFEYGESHLDQLNRHWVEALTDASFTNAGLHLMPEPAE